MRKWGLVLDIYFVVELDEMMTHSGKLSVPNMQYILLCSSDVLFIRDSSSGGLGEGSGNL